MRKLIAIVLFCLSLVACGAKEEPQKNVKEKYPFVMVDFLHNQVDADGDRRFLVYRCMYCDGVKDGLVQQEELLSGDQSNLVFILGSNKIKKKDKEEKIKALLQRQVDTARIVGKMKEARRKFLEDEANRITK